MTENNTQSFFLYIDQDDHLILKTSKTDSPKEDFLVGLPFCEQDAAEAFVELVQKIMDWSAARRMTAQILESRGDAKDISKLN
jgi:hypothetical protein